VCDLMCVGGGWGSRCRFFI